MTMYKISHMTAAAAAAAAAAKSTKAATAETAASKATATTAPDNDWSHAATPMLTPATIHGTEHWQEYEEDEEEHKDNCAQWTAFITVTRLLRRAGDLGRLVGGEFELCDNAIHARIDAAN